MTINILKKFGVVLFIFSLSLPGATASAEPAVLQGEITGIETAVLRQDYVQVEKLANALLGRKPPRSVLRKAQYYLGLSQLEQGRYDEAAASFKKISKNGGDASLREKACLGIFDAYYLKEDYDEAAQVIESLLKQNPLPEAMSLVYLKWAKVNLKLARWGEAHDYLQKIVSSFPNSLEVPAARQLLAEKQYFAVQVGSFSDRALAEQLAGELKQKQEYAYLVETADPQGRKFYRVRVGQLALLKEAKKLELKLSQAGYPTQIYP